VYYLDEIISQNNHNSLIYKHLAILAVERIQCSKMWIQSSIWQKINIRPSHILSKWI